MRIVKIAFVLCLYIGCASKGEGDRVATFEHVFEIDEQRCLELGLPPTRFAIEYPDNIEVDFPENGRNHITLKFRTGELVLEELWITKTDLKRQNRSEAVDWMNTFVTNYNVNYLGLKVEFLGEDNFNNQNVHQIRADVDFSNLRASMYNGDYKMILLIPFPERDDNLNAVSITMIAHEYSEIKSLRDFQEKGIVSRIFKTFRYLD